MKKIILLFTTLWLASHAVAADWKPALGRFGMTRWANDVSPDKVLPEYPRPQMVRKDWLNLNGLWNYRVVAREDKQPTSYPGAILVPFPIEAPLSGVGRRINAFPGRTYADSRLWYRRAFETPAPWKGRRILLHFGAVDWEATVYLNGKELGVHRGGYDAFSFDVTDALNREGPNELVVAVWDPTFEGGYPRGKQVDKPAGIYYTPCTGIWQTVWLEPVAEDHIESLRIVPDVDASAVCVTCRPSPNAKRPLENVQVRVLDGGKPVSAATGKAGEVIRIQIKDAKLWSPETPHLYDLTVTMGADAVTSYFGMRKVSVGPDKDGITRILLNDAFVLHNGVLDQGYWPDGIYTAPTDAALRFDIETIKQLGFNMSRKHLKVEPQRWYYWADKLGLLVWQDMPCSGDGIHAKPPAYAASDARRQDQFAAELRAMIAGRFNHPSIVSWVVFNEGMGLQNPAGYQLDDAIRAFMRRMADIAAEDKTRAINAESGAPMGQYQGWNVLDIGLGQIMDAHCYGTTKCLAPTKERASVIGEYGYAKYLDSIQKYRPLVKNPGISGLVWTQITDVENERNGLLSYDRSKFNEDPKQVAARNAEYGQYVGVGILAAQARDAPQLPPIEPLFDFPVRDTSVCVGGDGAYYLTGTTGHPTWWKTNEGIRVWKSADLKTWQPLGLVWTFERDGTWQKAFRGGRRAIWAPEIHYLKGTFWLTYCVNYGGTGILRSTTGKPEGPYADVKPDGPLTGEIDASLFQDDDGAVYFVYQDGKIARMKDDMTGLAEAPRLLKPANADHVGFEGAFLFKAAGRYYLACAEFNRKHYDCMIAGSDKLLGPYGDRYLAVPHGGHNMFFKDRAGRWWSTFFGHDPAAPFRERPAMLRVEFDKDGRIRPKR